MLLGCALNQEVIYVREDVNAISPEVSSDQGKPLCQHPGCGGYLDKQQFELVMLTTSHKPEVPAMCRVDRMWK